MQPKFETTVQLLRHEVLTHVAKLAMEKTLDQHRDLIPYMIVQGKKPRFRCCVYKERAVLKERVILACGNDVRGSSGIIQVMQTACEECPVERFTVTEACRGCIAHPCMEACPVGAISQINRRAIINQEKCIECGRCRQACPYGAITDTQRPCIKACPVKAISYSEDKLATIDQKKCINCGQCAYRCPFGAISDKSFITQVIGTLQAKDRPVYAVLAPAVVAQFPEANLGQIRTALKQIGFFDVVEAALGADMIVPEEAKELEEKIHAGSFLTTSCCPAFYDMVDKHFPALKGNVSTTVSPMIAAARYIKAKDANAVVVFIGPCIAKKAEITRESVAGAVDYTLTFEELFALFHATGIDPAECESNLREETSPFSRAFARSGGVTAAVVQSLKEANKQLEVRPVKCNGAEECIKALRLAKVGKLPENFIEGMVCVGGCIGGPAALNHSAKAKAMIDKFSAEAQVKTIREALEPLDDSDVDLHSHPSHS
ncbi:4Fe-4S dicluster domain-containing protein [Heliobacterium undosum]|uniref:4Fe-4S dicluster domain-containing protein n=1 Tax=Heliomicrobium undosum TaxID=121734 RepID=A0A845L9L7_9FIRM|nr:4Fe-4S dicluster domain-containing protein [Heliomicrobium undosum]MZP31320.1 4Fe-4S dicluster domain-containing protein [Heliomicrobium undosum]